MFCLAKYLYTRYHDRDSQIIPTRIGRDLTVIFTQELMKISIFFDDRDTQIAPTKIGRDLTVIFAQELMKISIFLYPINLIRSLLIKSALRGTGTSRYKLG